MGLESPLHTPAAWAGVAAPAQAAALGKAAGSQARSRTFLDARYHRIARRRGRGKAIVAGGNSILTTAWHLLSRGTFCPVTLVWRWRTSGGRNHPSPPSRIEEFLPPVTCEPATGR